MRLPGDNADSEGGAPAGAPAGVVVVGVKLDSQSKELLTWALVKVAQAGDHVVALHVLNSPTESKSSLLSLVNKFDSILAVYEGFCNLKQVDLKLKVCRGSSVKKCLVKEAKLYDGAKVIVGSSKGGHRMKSSVTVAKWCARKLPKDFTVYAVDNGKVLFWREGAVRIGENVSGGGVIGGDEINRDCGECLQRSCSGCKGEVQRRVCKVCSSSSISSDGSVSPEELDGVGSIDYGLALVPYGAPELDPNSNSITSQTSSESRYRWAFLRKIFVPKWRHSQKLSFKKSSAVQRVIRMPFQNSSSVVYPDQKQNLLGQHDEQCSDLDENKGAIVPLGPESSAAESSDDGFFCLPVELDGLHEKYSAACRLLSYQDVLSATSNFAPENLIGKGGSSHVYKGCLPDGKELALKILKPSKEALKEFVSEIEIITTLHHKNIISLFGFCYEDNNLLLAYDYLSRGSLEENIHGNRNDVNSFGWQERFKVAIGIAEALDYLHSGCAEPVIHKDVKSSNILLFDDFEPQLSDFGLANRPSNASSYSTSTDVAGTFGYLAPEYFMHGKVSDKIDVYAFGIVLLELLSGRKPIDRKQPKGQESLVMWAKPNLDGGKVLQLIDPSISSDYNYDQIERLALASNLCIRRSPKLRPSMNLVLKLIQGDEEAIKWAKQRVVAFDEVDDMDGEVIPPTNIQSHLSIALQDLDDDSLSPGSIEQTICVEDYLNGRWSRMSSFD